MERNEPGGRIAPLLGEFRDQKLERDFRLSGFFAMRASVRPLLAGLSVLLSAVMLAEILLTPFSSQNWIGISLRVLYMITAVLMLLRISSLTDHRTLTASVTVFEGLSISIWFYLVGSSLNAYSNLSVCLGVTALSLMVFLIPNRFIHAAALSAVTLLLSPLLYRPEMAENPALDATVAILFTLGATVAVGAVIYLHGLEKRNQYLQMTKLLRLSLTDPLTGIANRGRFNEALQSWVGCAEEYRIPLSLVLFDFDDFKRINDTYGHLIGDQVILATVNLVDEAIRRRDIFARWGGEEFTLLFPDTRLEEALEIVERLRQTIESNHYIRCGHVTASFGVVQHRAGESPEAFMDRADRQLYRAKAEGKNCIRSAG